MKLVRILSIAAIAGLLALSTASAATINGSMELGTLGTVINNGTGIGNTTSLTTTLVFSGSVFGDYAAVPVPLGTSFASLGPVTVDLTNFSTLVLTSAAYGTFTATSGVVVQQTASGICPGGTCGGFLDVYLLGTYSGLPGFDDTQTSLRISYTQSGAAISGSGTLTSPALPPPGVPEPATMALLGSALVGLGMYGRKRLAR